MQPTTMLVTLDKAMFKIKQRFSAYKNNFLAKRRPLKKQHSLKQSNLFIFPSLLGACYLLLIFLLWLLGTNYDNNLILALCYLLISVSLVSIFHTFFNLQGLRVSSLKTEPVFCGELAMIALKFERSSLTTHHSVEVKWESHSGATQARYLDWQNHKSIELLLPIIADHRGVFQPPKLSIKSYYPLGLLRCWSKLAMDAQVIVYPSATQGVEQFTVQQNNDNNAERSSSSNIYSAEREYQDMQLYTQGEAVNQIAWKHYARTQVLYKKNYEYLKGDHHTLNWDNYPGVETELRLQHLCYKVVKLTSLNQPFSLVLPSCTILMAIGEEHCYQALQALALFPAND